MFINFQFNLLLNRFESFVGFGFLFCRYFWPVVVYCVTIFFCVCYCGYCCCYYCIHYVAVIYTWFHFNIAIYQRFFMCESIETKEWLSKEKKNEEKNFHLLFLCSHFTVCNHFDTRYLTSSDRLYFFSFTFFFSLTFSLFLFSRRFLARLHDSTNAFMVYSVIFWFECTALFSFIRKFFIHFDYVASAFLAVRLCFSGLVTNHYFVIYFQYAIFCHWPQQCASLTPKRIRTSDETNRESFKGGKWIEHE